MKNLKQWIALLLLTALFFTSCSTAGGGSALSVVLAENENITILSENPVTVASGEDAVFQIEVAPGFSIRESSAYTYADGYITVKNVQFPTTVVVGTDFDVETWLNADPAQIPTGKEFAFSCQADGNDYGSVTNSVAGGAQASATQITVTAEPKADGRFVCWSIGGSLKDGGTPFVAPEQLTFHLSMDTELCANFAEKESATLIYDANGGQTADGGRYIRQDAPTDFYFYPHALANRGQMTRDNYVLYTYNTKPDGSGTDYTFGANVVTPESGTLILYAQWLYADPAPFTYRTEHDGVHIIGCDSDEAWVVVPETIEGEPVTAINTRAFDELTGMTTLVLNRNIESVDENAVYNCPNFTTLYLCDNIKQIPDSFHQNCPEFQTLHLGAVMEPTRMNQRGGTFHIKFQRLLKAQAEDKNAVVILAGSSSEYGFNSAVFEQEMNGEYYPVNFGTTAQISILFLLEAFKDYVDEGDIIIQAPETSESQLGGNDIVSNYWGCFEGVPELMSHVDLRNYTNLFKTLSEFNTNRYKMDPTSYSDHNEEIDRYGDNQTERLNPGPDYAVGKDKFYAPDLLTEENAERLNWAYSDIEDTGAKVYISFCPINVNSFSDKMKESSAQYAYQKRFEDLLDIPVISDFSDYVMEGKYFYNSDYHLSNEGSELRTKQLAADLKAQLDKEAKKN